MSTERFTDEGTTLWDFMDTVLVVCPKCEGQAQVTCPAGTGEVRLTCTHCGHARAGAGSLAEDAEALGRMKLEGTSWARCQRCGAVTVKDVHFPLTEARKTITCACGATWPAQLSGGFPAGGPAKDPHLGLPLWLQTEKNVGLLWALNAEHLAWLKAYVGAELREQTAPNHHNLMVRLPRWIKRAANRDTVLGMIETLEGRLAQA